MWTRTVPHSLRSLSARSSSALPVRQLRHAPCALARYTHPRRPQRIALCASQTRGFHVSNVSRAQGPTADALMENLTDLYSTAKDEFEIAAEETEKKTVYAEEDREAAKDALRILKEAYERAVRESDPDVAKEVQSRTGPRIRELENAVTAMEEMAMED